MNTTTTTMLELSMSSETPTSTSSSPQKKVVKKPVIVTSEEPKRYGKTVQKPATKKSPRSNQSKLPKTFPEVNKRFKEIREEMGLTQRELADKMGIHVSMMKSIENTVVVPNIYCIIMLSKTSGRSCDFILLGKK